MRKAEHQRHVGVRPDGQPFGVEKIRRVVAARADVDEADAVPARRPQPRRGIVRSDAGLVDLTVLGRRAPEHHHQLRMPRDHRPRGRMVHRQHRADDMRHDHGRGAETVVGNLVDESAEPLEKTAELRPGLVEDARARPARAREDRFVAPFGLDAGELVRGEIERIVPRNLDEGFGAARGSAGGLFEESAPHGRPRDSALVIERLGNRVQNGRWIGIAFEGSDADHAAVAHARVERAPLGHRNEFSAAVGHVLCSVLNSRGA